MGSWRVGQDLVTEQHQMYLKGPYKFSFHRKQHGSIYGDLAFLICMLNMVVSIKQDPLS